jgi:hypothetical protein
MEKFTIMMELPGGTNTFDDLDELNQRGVPTLFVLYNDKAGWARIIYAGPVKAVCLFKK